MIDAGDEESRQKDEAQLAMAQEFISHTQLEGRTGTPRTSPGGMAGEEQLVRPQYVPAARIAAVGVGGAGTNAINHMINVGVSGIEFIAMNTDAQALELALAPVRMRLGEALTHGLGAGGNPQIGQQAAEESYPLIRDRLTGFDMVFITAGMGGGTGTGAAPLVAQAARELGALTVAVVTLPFAFERRRKHIAEKGIEALREIVDALILVPNERLMELNPGNLGAFAAYRLADDILRQGIQGISDLITIPGLINLDFADIRSIMTDTGSALMAVCTARGEHRAEEVARGALSNPLLDLDIQGARGVIFNITASDDLTMAEVYKIAESISAAAHPEANIIFGSIYDQALDGAIKLTVVATGFEPRVVHPDLPIGLRAQMSEPQLAPELQLAPVAAPARKPQDMSNDSPRVGLTRSSSELEQTPEEEKRLRRLEELRVRRRQVLSETTGRGVSGRSGG